MKRLLHKILLLACVFIGLLALPSIAPAKVFADPQPLQQIEDNQTNCNNSSNAGVQKCIDKNPIVNDIQIIVNFLSAAVGIVVIGVIILGGIQYSLAGDNPTATGSAKKRIMNGLIALLAFIFTFAFLQWLIPGGIFS